MTEKAKIAIGTQSLMGGDRGEDEAFVLFQRGGYCPGKDPMLY
jgi:hypothetical protein